MSKQWAIRMLEQVQVGAPGGGAIPAFQGATFEISDLRTGDVGHFKFVGPGWGVGAPIGYDAADDGGDWTYFNTKNDMSLDDFADGHARIYGGSVGMGLSIGWGGIVFQEADIDQRWWQGDDIDLGMAGGRGFSLGIGWSPGDVQLERVTRVETDFATAIKALDYFETLVTATENMLGGRDADLVEYTPIGALTGALHDFRDQVDTAVHEARVTQAVPHANPLIDAESPNALDQLQCHVVDQICEPAQNMTVDVVPDDMSIPPIVVTPPPPPPPPPAPAPPQP